MLAYNIIMVMLTNMQKQDILEIHYYDINNKIMVSKAMII